MRIATLRTANEELKLGANQEVVAAVEHQEKELKAIMDQLRAELGSSKNRRKNLEQEAEGPKVVTAYKASRGFKSILEKIWRISYEFGYYVALKRF
ncbi:hypothetical protein BHM03_00007732 [Ensete ventricosum]|uniref:Uncharacterized protein n=1 Tax=Ensete ventricosum TaxID=4639 RepID=A0A445MCB4_ENSVE|nr:hypothetical protein BHM03_00007732 [Ensete ventricosum]